MRSVLALGLLFAAAGSLAQSVHYYKSVHADGTVTYSDTRPPTATTVEQVKVHGDGAAAREQGEQRMQEIQAAGKRLDEQRAEEAEAERKHRERLAQARQEVADAERNLATVQESKRSATKYRIGIAEDRVQLARKRLKEVQFAGP